nr:MAG TPA: INTRON-ENCODED ENDONUCLEASE I-PPOI/DNA COMPLEX (HOMING ENDONUCLEASE-DNA), INTRON, DNA.8A [Caudoviricetes sp.]
MISHEDLLKTLRYEPETGKFFWLSHFARSSPRQETGSNRTQA